jgi:drug/metabolite transporter (DMT)-like permease
VGPPEFPVTAAIQSNDATSLQGIALGATAYSLFAFHDALVKSVINEMPVAQIMSVRSLVIVIGCLAISRGGVIADLGRSSGKPLILLRAVLTLAAWCMYYSMGRYLQLATMTTLYYVAPIITLILAVIFLRERLTVPRVSAAVLGFAGVVIACNPAGLNIAWPELLVLGAALLWALAMIVMRSIPRTDSALAQIFGINGVFLLAMGIVTSFTWQGMDLRQLAILLAIGALGGLAQYLLVNAARLVPAGVLGTVEYSALVWAFVFGYLFWNEVPALYVYAGAALIVCAGAFVAFTERRRRGAILETP